MDIFGLLIPADMHQPVHEVRPDNGTDFKLAQLYALLSCGGIEILSLGGGLDGLIMVMDNDGKAEKPRNERATQLANFVSPKQLVTEMLRLREAGIEVIWLGDPITDSMTETDYIAGDVLVCGDDQVR
ncbi:MAG TPA: hypothetical protein VKX46_12075 [Ktedonobacteraceae bacterium]|nr:hypothetical protein [Ktedonobacteraceae bacterium]